MVVSVRLEASAKNLLVVLCLHVGCDFYPARGVNASAASPTDFTLVLARPHFRVLRA